MSLLLATTLQAGQNGNPASNCFLAPDPAVPGQFKLKRGNAGGGIQDLLTIDPSGNVFVDAHPATGARTKQLATMQKFADEFAILKATNGWQKLSSGLILQWGVSSTDGTKLKAVTYPIAFPTTFVATVTNHGGVVPGSTSIAYTGIGSETNTGALFYSSEANIGFRWFAIGY